MSQTDTTRLRIAEAVALFATVLAVGLTALLEPATAAVESNPFAAGLLDALGWTGAGIVAVVGEAALFGGWRRLSARGYPRAALGAGAGIAAVGVADVLVNLLVLSRVGIPETARLGHYGGATAAVALVAGLAYFRSEVRVAVDMLVYALGDVTSRLSGVEARSVALAVVVVSSMFVGAVTLQTGPLPAVERANAATTFTDDFEDGNIDGAQAGAGEYTFVSSPVKSGSNAAQVSNGGSGGSVDVNMPNSTYSQVSFWINPANFDNNNQFGLKNHVKSDGSSTEYMLLQINDGGVYDKGSFNYYSQGSGQVDLGINAETGKWYRFAAENIDYSANTMDIVVYDDSGNELARENNVDVGQNMQQIGGYDTFHSDGTTYDLVEAGPGGNPVSGSITGADGSPIDSATIELRQSGSAVQSTTTANGGSYSFSGVSDGDYTVRASASGYQNASKSITVSGSPVTADLTLYETGSYEQVLVLSDETGKFVPDESSVITFRYTGDGVPTAGPFYDESSWTWEETSSFNWQNTTSQRLKDGEIYAFAVTDGSTRRFNPAGTLYEFVGFYGGSENPKYLRIRDQSENNEVVAADTDEGLTVSYEGNDTNTSLDDLDYTVPDGGGGVIYEGGGDFDDPSGDYQSTISDDLLANLTDDGSTDVPEVEYNGSTADGGILNGSTGVLDTFPGFTSSGNDSAVGGFGPTGGGGGASTGQQIGGLAIIAGAGYFAYRRFGNGQLSGLTESIPGLGGR